MHFFREFGWSLLMTSFPEVPTLMSLNDLEIKKLFLWLFREHSSRVDCATITGDRPGQHVLKFSAQNSF